MSFDRPQTPKALTKIGDYPILWHLAKYFAFYDFDEIWIAIGHRGDEIVRCFEQLAASGLDFDVSTTLSDSRKEKPIIRLIETGEETSTGGRIRQLTEKIDAPFLLSWCDGLADIDLSELIAFHRSHGKPATLTAVHPPGRFGHLTLRQDIVEDFTEKPQQTKDWINGSFFVLDPDWRRWNQNEEFDWERECLAPMAHDGALMAFRHSGFWQCMDTGKERDLLNDLWSNGNPPWKKWD